MLKATSPEWSQRVQQQINSNLAEIQSRIESACHRSHRDASEIQLVAVTKYTPLEIVVELEFLNQTVLGENRPQQLVDRSQQLSEKFSWHLIGQLQRNKVRSVLPSVDMIHSIDSLRLLAHVDRVAGEENRHPRVLLQVNISGEESKSGFQRDEILTHWEEITEYEHIRAVGLMTMAPQTSEEATLRECFGGLRILRDELNSLTDRACLAELSMGMSSDFEIAIEEGATLIRLGRSIFTGCDEGL